MLIKETFEATYPRYDFAPLVRMGLTIAAMISGHGLLKDNGKADHVAGSTFGSAA